MAAPTSIIHSPFRHWVRGLFIELMTLGLFLAGLFVLSFIVIWAL